MPPGVNFISLSAPTYPMSITLFNICVPWNAQAGTGLLVRHMPPFVMDKLNPAYWGFQYDLLLSEPEFAANAITSQRVHLSGEFSHALPYPGANQRHVPQGIRADSLKQRSCLIDLFLQILVVHHVAQVKRPQEIPQLLQG